MYPNGCIFVSSITNKNTTMKATELTPGKVVTFTPTGNSMTITLVTEKRISWTIEATRGVGNGKNIYRKMWSTLEQFQEGLNDGTYIINK